MPFDFVEAHKQLLMSNRAITRQYTYYWYYKGTVSPFPTRDAAFTAATLEGLKPHKIIIDAVCTNEAEVKESTERYKTEYQKLVDVFYDDLKMEYIDDFSEATYDVILKEAKEQALGGVESVAEKVYHLAIFAGRLLKASQS